VKRKRTAVDPVIAMFSEATTSKPSGATAARSRSTVTEAVAMCTTASSLMRLVSVSGGMSMMRWGKPGGRFCAPGGGVGCCRCGGTRAPPVCGMLTTGAVLSAASCAGPLPTRLLMNCDALVCDAMTSPKDDENDAGTAGTAPGGGLLKRGCIATRQSPGANMRRGNEMGCLTS
jgi:hypothetical protein